MPDFRPDIKTIPMILSNAHQNATDKTPALWPVTSFSLASAKANHGFFTREGGVSTGIYEGLNCGPGSDDDPAHVAENRRRVATFLDVPDTNLLSLWQIHSPDVATVTAPWTRQTAPKADAMVTATPGIALGILTADCTPVLFADREAPVVGAAHAGWKGALGGVLENTAEAMIALGAKRDNLLAAIGPSIRQSSYEVGPEFPAAFIDQDASNNQYFIPSERAGHFLFDLAGYCRDRLAAAGIKTIETVGRDTRMDEKRFFSYRRTTLRKEPDYGRQISAITVAADHPALS